MKHRKFLRCILIILFILSSFPDMASAAKFSDIQGHWGQPYIEQLAEAGYIKGYPDGSFKPDTTMSKAEFVTALVNCAGLNPSSTATPAFPDINSHWAMGYINEAARVGILVPSEFPTGFKPDEPVLRSQAAAMLVRALDKEPDNQGEIPFADKDEVERSLYRGYIKTANDLGILSGFPNGNFEPYQAMTRAQVSTVLVKFLEIKGTSAPSDSSGYDTTPNPGSNSNISSDGNIKYVAIGSKYYDYKNDTIIFKMGVAETNATSISADSSKFLINNSLSYPLNTTNNNPEIVVGNICYGVNRYTVSGDTLIADTSYKKIYSFTNGANRYFAYYVPLYVKSAMTDNYLADMEVISEYSVNVNGQRYDLSSDKMTIELDSNNFYDVVKVNISDTSLTPQLIATDPVIYRSMSLSDIAAIFVGTDAMDLSKVSTIEFIINGSRYRLYDVTIDSDNNFVIGRNTYSPDKVSIVINDTYYKLKNVSTYDKKFIFYLEESDAIDWVRFNSDYRSYSDVQILKDGILYPMDRVLVVQRNVLRINNKQFTVDKSVKCKVDNTIYDIDSIDYDSNLGMTVIKATESKDGYWSSQPLEYVFWEGSTRLQDGASGAISIYADNKWLTFDQIMITDPSKFSYDGKSYDLIGSRVRMTNYDYLVVDTAWHGSTQVLDVYLQR